MRTRQKTESWYSYLVYGTVHKNSEENGRTLAPSGSGGAFDVVSVAASAGGIEALSEFLAALPKDFPAAIFVVQHLPSAAQYASKLDLVLQRTTNLRVKWAEEGECMSRGIVFLAPQDRHLSIDSKGVLRLTAGPKINSVRPAADPLFASVAARFGARAIAVVLSGTLQDGAKGAWNIARRGGRVLVQDDISSRFFDMPRATFQAAGVDFMFAPAILAHVLVTLVMVEGAAEWFRVWRDVPAQFRGPLHNELISPWCESPVLDSNSI